MLTIFYWSVVLYGLVDCTIFNMTHNFQGKILHLDAASVAVLTIFAIVDLATYAYRHRKHYSELI